MSRHEAGKALLLVGPQHIEENRPISSKIRAVLAEVDPLGIGIVSTVLKNHGFETRLHTMESGHVGDLSRHIENANVVFISSRFYDTNLAQQAAKLAQKAGKKVIAGGYGPTLTPDLFMESGTIVRGEAEPVLDSLIDDLESGHLQPVYDATLLPPFDLNRYILPDRSIYPNPPLGIPKKYPQEWSRGCYNHCPFCSPTILQRELRSRDPQKIIEEVESIGIKKSEFLFSADLNTLSIPRETLITIFTYFKEHKINWMTEGTVAPLLDDLKQFGKENSLLALMSPQGGQGGCYSFLYGADDLTKAKVSGSFDKEKTILQEATQVFRKFGIPLNLSVIVGLDNHIFPGSFFEIAETLEQVSAPYTFFHIATPYRGTPWGNKVFEEGRIIDSNTIHYSHRQVVATPNQMTCQELQQGYYWLQEKFYNPKNIAHIYRVNQKPSPNLILNAFMTGLPFAIETYLGTQELRARGAVDSKMLNWLDGEYKRWKSTNHEN